MRVTDLPKKLDVGNAEKFLEVRGPHGSNTQLECAYASHGGLPPPC